MDINNLFPASFLKAADLQGQPRTATIESCTPEPIGEGENKPVLRFTGIPKGLVLNRTNATVIANVFGNETDNWRGRQITLFSMPVSYQGRMVDGIRVQAAPPAPPPAPAPATPTASQQAEQTTQTSQAAPTNGQPVEEVDW
jgi:hypothetical protein